MLTVKILLIEPVTHDVKRFILEKPEGYKFTPGQAVNIAIKKPGFEDQKHEFTFTSLNEDKVLEFTIKGYKVSEHPDHKGVTEELHKLSPGDELLIEENPWGTINYKGKGTFFAGGAGITPFIAIFKDLHKKGELSGNKLFYANKTKKDIIYEHVWEAFFNEGDYINVLSREEIPGYEHGRIDEEFIKKYVTDFKQKFYVCGPPPFLGSVKEILTKLGASTESVVFEE